MKLAVILSVALLTGCSAFKTNPTADFPPASTLLTTRCPDLEQIDPDNHKASDGSKVIANNYKKYKQCQNQVDSWIYWYTEEKKNYEK